MQNKHHFKKIEKNMQRLWQEQQIFTAKTNAKKQKKYILDMFPYPSGQGLHVGHLLGYYASDVVAIEQRMKGYEVLHPMGFDAFGLPAEQHAIETGQHPAITVEKNIANYTKLLKETSLSFDWQRSFSTTDPSYYRWTQWIFLQLFNSWYNKEKNCASPIQTLLTIFASHGNNTPATTGYIQQCFTSTEWLNMSETEKQKILSHYRLAYLSPQTVNWCPALGTVLANEEVKEGLSERGGHPVIRKQMMQWSLRIQPYADRLLEGLDNLDWSESIKETQRNWIGKSQGVDITFTLDKKLGNLQVFTTRIDTIFGATFLALAPEHPCIQKIITYQEATQNDFLLASEIDFSPEIEEMAMPIVDTTDALLLQQLKDYIAHTKCLSEKERMQQKDTPGMFTGHYAIHPLTLQKIPIFIADYVLMHYGLGAIMGVPAHDQRDYDFAKHFNLPIIQVIDQDNITESAYAEKEGKLIHSHFANGLSVAEAQQKIMQVLAEKKQGEKTIKYRLHDPVFARQRYWGEPLPIYFKEGIPTPLSEKELPLELPNINNYQPTTTGEPPLARAPQWHIGENPLETSTMPAWAGSSWYFLRYMDPENTQEFVSKKAYHYWQQVDLYVGGKEHATGHLIYARFFTKFLYDLGYISIDEPFQKLFNQGMIQNFSQLVYRIKDTNKFVSHGLHHQYDTTPLRIDINLVKNNRLDIEAFKQWRPDFNDATFILENGEYICGELLEKMSKSKHNSISPEPILEKYGADILRLYLLFLGPAQQDKPWSEKGIQGVARFIKKVFMLFDRYQAKANTQNKISDEVCKALHKAIQQVQRGIDRFTFNTSISALMILVNTFSTLSHTPDKTTIEDFIRLLAPFAPHTAEHLWQLLGHKTSVIHSGFPICNPIYLEEETIMYPVTINGKLRATIVCDREDNEENAKQKALAHPCIQKWLKEKKIKKIIFIHKRMINIVV